MGNIEKPQPVQLFCGAIFAPGADISAVRSALEAAFGPIDSESDVFPFDQTDYYEAEMGGGLSKIFFSFEKLIDPGDIAAVKIRTNSIESELAAGAPGRPVNLDPGCVSLAKMVLATTKDNYHRLYLRDGIYAEVTLQFTNKSFRPFQWTYPDYRKEEYITYFNELRDSYRQKLKAENFLKL